MCQLPIARCPVVSLLFIPFPARPGSFASLFCWHANSHAWRPGHTVTKSARQTSVISLEAGASSVVVGGSTIPVAQIASLATVTALAAAGTSPQPSFVWIIASIGGYVMSGSSTVVVTTIIGGAGSKTSSSSVVQSGACNGTIYTGAATQVCSKDTWVKVLSVGVMGLIALLLS